MASIQKRGNTYQYTVSNMVDGKSKPIRKGGFHTEEEARLAAEEIEWQLGKGRTPHARAVPFHTYFDRWVLLFKSHVSLSTQEHYKHTGKVIRRSFGSKPIQDISRQDYQQLIHAYGSTRSKETVVKVHKHIRACVRDAVEKDIITHDFTRGLC